MGKTCRVERLNDYTLYPLIRPGSFVEIDASTTRSREADGKTNSVALFILSNCATPTFAVGVKLPRAD
jgi:hypothetical protein